MHYCLASTNCYIWFLFFFFANWLLNRFLFDFNISFLQDDAHIFCLDDQIKDEIRGVLDLTEEILLQFGFEKYEVNLSTRLVLKSMK